MADVVLNIKTQIADLQKDMKKVQAGQKNLAKQSTKTQKIMQKNISGTTKAVQGLGQQLAAVLTIGAAVQFTKAIISVRSEFEKYRAVLTNTLGSAEAANREFEKIQDFAAKTPFAVRTLTDAFVRLVNQGFKPTTEQMRKLGDLAASTGKDFIQLTEAILDAQTGEFERLKEFGIKAKKEGDKVTFTFKEQATQIDFTSKSIQEYILSLGEMEGVSGAMAAVSETLGGQINNLSDKWDHLLDVLGGRTTGVFRTVIEFLSEMLEKITLAAEVADPMQRATNSITRLKDSLVGLDKETQLTQIVNEFQIVQMTIDAVRENTKKLEEERPKIMERIFEDRVHEKKLIDASIESNNDYIESLQLEEELLRTLSENIAKGLVLKKEDIDTTDEQTKSLKELRKERQELIKSLALTQKLEEEETKHFEDYTDFIMGFGEEQVSITEDIQDQLKDAVTDRVDHEIAEYKRGIDATQQAEAQKQLLIEGTALAAIAGFDLIAAADRDNAALQQTVAIAQAIINGALGITKTGAQLGYPLAIPFQIALGLQTLAQIATIRSQKFERGGYDVLKGRRHAQGGVDIGIGEAEAGEGLAVFSREATQKYGKFLPAFVKAINENDADLGYSDGAYMISFDDSKSVNELKGIRQLLSKTEIRYQGRYRIETRKGHTTKVRI